MNIDLRQGPSSSNVWLDSYDLAFCGDPLDDRGRIAIAELSGRSSNTFTVEYDEDSMSLKVDGQRATQSQLKRIFAEADSTIALETTTLGFVEVLLCCRAARGAVATLDCLYVEPQDYRRSNNSHLLHKRDFELSGEIAGFRGIPGATRMLNDRRSQKCVFFLGFEGARFRRAFTDLEMLQGSRSSVVFGIPAFNPGWEMDSIANNVSVMRDEHINSVYFCGADNPRAAVDFLKTTYDGLEQDETMFVAPLGTNPQGLGTALFVAQRKDVGVIYDHPRRTADRSTAVGEWHRFSVSEFG